MQFHIGLQIQKGWIIYIVFSDITLVLYIFKTIENCQWIPYIFLYNIV